MRLGHLVPGADLPPAPDPQRSEHTARAPVLLQVELQVLDVGEPDFVQVAGGRGPPAGGQRHPVPRHRHHPTPDILIAASR